MSEILTLLTSPKSSRVEIKKKYTKFIFRPAIGVRHYFSLALRKDWKIVALNPSEPSATNSGSEIALARRISGCVAEISVHAVLLNREVNPADWQANWLRRNQYEVIAGRIIPMRSGAVGDFLATRYFEGAKYVYRSLAIKNGKFLYLILARCPFTEYWVLEEDFLIALQTFELLNPAQELFVEPMREYVVETPAKVSYLFPESWEYRVDATPPPGGSAITAKNLRRDIVVGYFTFISIPLSLESSHRSMSDKYIDQLAQNGIHVEREELRASDWPDFRVAMLKAARNESELQVACAVGKSENGWLLFGMVGATSLVDSDLEAINRRAWEVAVESCQAGLTAQKAG